MRNHRGQQSGLLKRSAVSAAFCLAVLCAAGPAHAGPVLSVLGDGTLNTAITGAKAQETAFLAGLAGLTVNTEDFESGLFVAGSRAFDYTSPLVGNFHAVTPGNDDIGSSCGTRCNDGLAILNKATTPFDGRFAVEGDSGKWLDSNDYKKLAWTPGSSVTQVGFFITDINDVHAKVAIHSLEGATELDLGALFSTDLPSGKVYYVTITDVLGISGLDFHSDAGERFNDGYGIDRFTTAVPPPHVPEPGSLLILGAGLVGLAARRRHSARA